MDWKWKWVVSIPACCTEPGAELGAGWERAEVKWWEQGEGAGRVSRDLLPLLHHFVLGNRTFGQACISWNTWISWAPQISWTDTQASCLLFAPTWQSHFSCSNTLQLLLFGCGFWCWLLFSPLHLQLLLLHAVKSSGISPDTLTAAAAPMQISAGSACLLSQTVWHYNCLVLIFPLPRLSICFQFLHLLGWLRYPTGFCPRHPLLHLLCSQLWNTGTLKHFYKQDSITGLFCLPEILAGTQEGFHLYLLHASLAVELVIAALHKSEFFAQFCGQECAVSVQCHSTCWANGQGGGEHLKKGFWRWWILHNSPAFPVVNLENYFGIWWEEARFQNAEFNSGAHKLQSHG